jgi:membrane-bound metal-dependent hydrolase YbcI (DUF457 family)
MTGKSHLATNISCAVVITNVLVYAGYTYSGWHASSINSEARYALNECVGNHSNMNGVLWLAAAVILFLIGTLLPDIDSPKSIISKLLHFHLPIEHRTWTHTIWVVIAIAVGSIFFRPLMFLGFGYTLHLFWDSLSAAGCCWFYPFEKYKSFGSNAKVKEKHILKLYHTGKAGEYVLLGIIITLTVAMCIWFALNNIYTNALHIIYGS